jgi:hypothetical protein
MQSRNSRGNLLKYDLASLLMHATVPSSSRAGGGDMAKLEVILRFGQICILRTCQQSYSMG